MKLNIKQGLAAALALCVFTGAALAQPYPSKPVKVMIPYGPGSGIDVVVRMLNEALSKNLGQQFVAENRAGAAGTIAAAFVASQPADGYTLLSDSSSHTIIPSLRPNMPFDTARDFAGVTTLFRGPSDLTDRHAVSEDLVVGQAEEGEGVVVLVPPKHPALPQLADVARDDPRITSEHLA